MKYGLFVLGGIAFIAGAPALGLGLVGGGVSYVVIKAIK